MRFEIEIADDLYARVHERHDPASFTAQLLERVFGPTHVEALEASFPPHLPDALTGLRSRRALEDATETRLNGAAGRLMARFQCVDVAGMHNYVGTHGLVAGDAILASLADCLRALYQKAAIYRIGPDQFVVDLGDQPAVPPLLRNGTALRHALVEVAVEADYPKQRAYSAIMVLLELGMIDATVQGATIQRLLRRS